MKKRTFLLIFGLSLTTISLCYGGWAIRRPMPHARYGAFVATVNNKLYVIGGLVNQNTSVSYNEEYDPVNDTWISRAPMPTARGLGVCAVVNNKIYCIGGVRARNSPIESVNVYDPALNQWQRRRRVPIQHYIGYNGGIIDDSIYVCSGYFTNASSYTDTVIVYSVTRDSWFVRHSMNVARADFGCAVANNHLYSIGGLFYNVYPNINEEYTPAEDTWRIQDTLPVKRSALVCTAIDNYIYAIGGERQMPRIVYNRVDIYNTLANTWMLGESLNYARSYAGATTINNHIYVVGGISRSNNTMSSLEENTTEGIEEIGNQAVYVASISVFPNPFKNRLTFRICNSNGQIAKVNIYNETGCLVKTIFAEKTNSLINWDGTDNYKRKVTAGVYFAEVVGGSIKNSTLIKIQLLK
jgi:N-acetylneuraminic acid mutarotase